MMFNLELLLLSRIIVTLETLAVLLTCNGKKLWMSINTWLDFCSCSLDTAWNCLFLSLACSFFWWLLLARRKFSCRSNLFFLFIYFIIFLGRKKGKAKNFWTHFEIQFWAGFYEIVVLAKISASEKEIRKHFFMIFEWANFMLVSLLSRVPLKDRST